MHPREREQYERILFRIGRYCAFPLAIFAFILILDQLFPAKDIPDKVQHGYQHTSKSKYGATLHSYMVMDRFHLEVPHEAHLKYPYHDENKPLTNVTITPIFNVPIYISYPIDGEMLYFELPNTVHNMFLPFPWLLLISSLFTIIAYKFNKYTYPLAFLPFLFAAFIYIRF
jgi:hypothetical protein